MEREQPKISGKALLYVCAAHTSSWGGDGRRSAVAAIKWPRCHDLYELSFHVVNGYLCLEAHPAGGRTVDC